jgi:hypothetical protein
MITSAAAMTRAASIFDLTSRFASCTPGVLDACIRAVAAESSLLDIMPGLSARDVALIAQNALQAHRVATNIADLVDMPIVGSDWTLAVLAEVAFDVAEIARKGKAADQKEAFEFGESLIEAAAASTDRSPVLWYEDILFHAAQRLVRRGDRLGLVRQTECVAESLGFEGGSNTMGTLRDLALFHLDLGELETGLSMLAEILRSDPSDVWSYNCVAMRGRHIGLASLARLAAERGLRLVGLQGGPEGLTEQLTQFQQESETGSDRSDAPRAAIEDLADALRTDFDAGEREPPGELARRLVPEVASARVKRLPPMPDDATLSATAAGLREVLRAEPSRRSARVSSSAPVRSGPRVGRNDPCPCGSGKKYKKCCGAAKR